MKATTNWRERFQVFREKEEVTQNGWFGGEADYERRFKPGPTQYRVDGRSVTREEFERLWLAEEKKAAR